LAAGRSIPEIFEQDGEAGFRALEAGVIRDAADGPGAVIATGGGAVLAEENRRTMRRTGVIVHVHVEEAEALSRLGRTPTGRPLLTDPGAWSRLASERTPLYRE